MRGIFVRFESSYDVGNPQAQNWMFLWTDFVNIEIMKLNGHIDIA
jgi:hypothetical protein